MSSLNSLTRQPDVGGPAQPMLIVDDLQKHFAIRSRFGAQRVAIRAVDGISFEVSKGETLGIVGESGCGKSTTAKLLMHLLAPDRGRIIVDGQKLDDVSGISVRQLRQNMQMVFQDSFASLNPRLTAEDAICFGLRSNGFGASQARERSNKVLEMVGLTPRMYATRYPHELSGGQRQRVNIARALALMPRIIILDEAVSALDKSVEAQVLNLLMELKEELALTYIFISHDLSVVQYVSDKVAVMYLGKIVEFGPVDVVYTVPRHPYTAALLASRLSMDPNKRVEQPPLSGDPPNPINPPSGCRFRTRCAFAEEPCARIEPKLLRILDTADHHAACHMGDLTSGHSRATQEAIPLVPSL